jgi:hypothetical protein
MNIKLVTKFQIINTDTEKEIYTLTMSYDCRKKIRLNLLYL